LKKKRKKRRRLWKETLVPLVEGVGVTKEGGDWGRGVPGAGTAPTKKGGKNFSARGLGGRGDA